MDSDDSAGFGHAFVSILAAGLLALQCLITWVALIWALWYVVTDIEVFYDPYEVQSFVMQVAEIVVPAVVLIANLVIAPWIAWSYLRSDPRSPSRKERIGAGFIVVANLLWAFWYALELSLWPPDFFDVTSMSLAALIAVLVTSISFSQRPVGLSAG